jgi:hypothetical protein
VTEILKDIFHVFLEKVRIVEIDPGKLDAVTPTPLPKYLDDSKCILSFT